MTSKALSHFCEVNPQWLLNFPLKETIYFGLAEKKNLVYPQSGDK
jgi:hypothetical protein